MSVRVPAAFRRRVAEHFASCCAYCRTAESLSVAIFELEHITPRSAGGETTFENICFSCPTCNRYKAYRTSAIDPEDIKRVETLARGRTRATGEHPEGQEGPKVDGER